jgi:SAM-dependent methyltransferase
MKEEEIRKRIVFNKYLELVEKDVKELFDFKSFIEIKCPACDDDNYVSQFEKLGFRYVSCNNCFTLYVNPRPPVGTIREFYSKSPSTTFWINEFFKPVMDVRREKIFKPRAKFISGYLSCEKNYAICDIGAGFGLFLEELKKIHPQGRFIAIEPSVEMSEICSSKRLETEKKFLEDITDMDESIDILTAFEITEHLLEPARFFKKCLSLLKRDGVFFLTTLNGKGFDIRMLWENSKSVFPPHHLNFFNTYSIELLLKKVGFEVVDKSTPGLLDWDIIEGMIKNENVNLDRFWLDFAEEGSAKAKKELQEWIIRNKLSSHMSVVAKKPF